ncbi:Dehydrogenase/reductase SDR family protein 7-like [Nymphon striatum]|nr:Dehydrogenase/reductase SDR family protein 7-like [Nymphon striatum]
MLNSELTLIHLFENSCCLSIQGLSRFQIKKMFAMDLIRLVLHGVLHPFSIPRILWSNLSRFCERKLPTKRLENKVIIITGANSGLGEALAHICYELGSYVVLCGRKYDELYRVKNELLAKNLNCQTHEPMVLVLDLTKLTEIPDKVNEVFETYGHVDVLINNAGIGYRGEIVSTKLETDIRLMVTNYFGQVALTKAVLPYMQICNSGSIVAVSSIQGRISIPYRSAYSASKHALQAFFDCLRSEVEKDRIHVCVVSPGYIRTNLSCNALTGSGKNYGSKKRVFLHQVRLYDVTNFPSSNMMQYDGRHRLGHVIGPRDKLMDPTTASGMEPRHVAFEIIKAVILKKKEIILSPFSNKIALLIRSIIPSLYFYVMSLRASKLKIDSEDHENTGGDTDLVNSLPGIN